MKTFKNGRILMGLGIFLAFMLVCTLVSKGIYASRLPQVTVQKPKKMSINHEVKAVGNVKQGRELAVNVPAGLRVSEVMVIPGDTVEAGQTLFLLDSGYLKELISDQELEMQKLKLQIATLRNNLNLSGEQKNRAMQRAGEDAVNAAEDAQKAVDRAAEDENKARQELQDHSSKEPGITSEEKRRRRKEEYREWQEKLNEALKQQRSKNAEKEALQKKVETLQKEIADLKGRLQAGNREMTGGQTGGQTAWFAQNGVDAAEERAETVSDTENGAAAESGLSGEEGSGKPGEEGSGHTDVEETGRPAGGEAEASESQSESAKAEPSESRSESERAEPSESQSESERAEPSESQTESGSVPPEESGANGGGGETAPTQPESSTEPAGQLEQKEKELAGAQEALAAAEAACQKADERVAALQEEEQAAPDFAAEDAELAAWVAQQKSLQNAVTAAQRQLEDAQDAKEEKSSQAGRSLEDSLMPEMSDAALGMYQLELSKAARDVEEMKALLAENGEVRAERTGTVTGVGVSVGESTTAGAAVIFADTSQPLQFEVFLDKEQKKYVELGAQGELELGTGSMGNAGIPVTVDYLMELESAPGSYLALMILPEETGRIGQSGTFIMNVQSDSYPVCIPLDALHADENQRYFVYVLGEADTILGKELTAEKRMVEVLEKNDRYAALEPGVVDDETQLITSATKEFADGDVIRMKEG